MSIIEKLLILGKGLLNKKKYDLDFKYDKSEFLSIKFAKKRLDQVNLHKNIYKRL